MTIQEYKAHLAKEMEGRLYLHVYLQFAFEKYQVSADYYTVKNGEVYMVNNGIEQKTGDDLGDTKSQCEFVGQYNPKEIYNREYKTYSPLEIKKMLKLV